MSARSRSKPWYRNACDEAWMRQERVKNWRMGMSRQYVIDVRPIEIDPFTQSCLDFQKMVNEQFMKENYQNNFFLPFRKR